jgi:hypothetical protein
MIVDKNITFLKTEPNNGNLQRIATVCFWKWILPSLKKYLHKNSTKLNKTAYGIPPPSSKALFGNQL